MTSDEEQVAARTRRRMPWIIGAAAVVIALVLGIGFATGWGAGGQGADEPGTGASASPSSGAPKPTPSSTGGAVDPTDPAETEEPETEPSASPRETLAPVPLDQPVAPAEGVNVTLSSIRPIAGEASVPGEVAGPALEITVHVENAGSGAAVTDTLVVNVYYGDQRTPANILVNPRKDLPLSIDAGDSADGLYAFSVPEAERGRIVVEVDLSVDLPVVLFEGAVS